MRRKVFGGISLLVALIVAAALGVAFAQETTVEGTTGGQVTGDVTVQDQSGDGATVQVQRASISGGNGWVVIHNDANGKPGEDIGWAYLQEGDSSNITVQLDKPISSSQKLYAMLHVDDPADQNYTFPDGDKPVMADGAVVVKPFQYTVSGGGQGGGTVPETGGLSVLLVGGAALVALGAAAGYLARRRA